MSALGAAFARGLAGLGGPGAAAAIVAGGIVVGALGGGLAATQGSGGGQPASATGKLAVYACPDSGAPIVMIQGGQKLLVTGRTEDSAWLRIHFPEPGRTEAWVQASPLQVDGAVASLPVATCMPELAIASPSLEPAMSLTAVQNNPPSEAPSPEATPTPPPTPSPTPSAVPNARPTLSSLTASTNRISYDTGNYCPTAVKKVTFRAKAADSIGVASVALYWREPGAGSFARTGMTRVAGSATSGTWQVSLDTAVNGITKAGRLAYYAVATDGDGATRRIPTEGSGGVTVSVCVNQGPTITAVSPASGTAIFWDPLGAPGNCQTARDITATVKDSDGIESVTLFYRRPGAASYSSKPMDSTTLPGKWYANLDSLGDEISIASPPTDALRWYIKAVDKAGKATQLATRTLTVRRCDSEATFKGLGQVGPSQCAASTSLDIQVWASDGDQPGNGLKVDFHWSIRNPRTGLGPITGKMTATTKRAEYYGGTTSTFDGSKPAGYYQVELSVYTVTTDQYGGTTTSPTAVSNFSCQ
jgi:hypothetical protein